MQKVLTLTQEECLQTKEREPTDRIPPVTTFNPHTTFIAEIAKRNWNFIQSKERLSLIFNKPPLVAYRPCAFKVCNLNTSQSNTKGM